ncbi:MAG: hypothetical protein ACREO1_09605 [Arenimonas sp.]
MIETNEDQAVATGAGALKVCAWSQFCVVKNSGKLRDTHLIDVG